MNKPLVLIITGPQGHFSIAKSIEQTLSLHYQTKLVQVTEPFIGLYTPIYRLFPWAFKLPFLMSQLPGLLPVVKKFNLIRYQKKILHLIEKEKPQIVVSTYFMFHPTLSKICRQKQIPFITPLTDPWSVHPLLIDKGATNLVFDKKALLTAQKIQAQANYEITGWFVRQEYEQTYSQNSIRQQLGLKKDIFTILMVSGSEGSTTVMRILPGLITSAKPIQIIVACGTNQKMLNNVNQFQKLLGEDSRSLLQALPFEPNLYLYMQAADIVVGKAGPNTVFESIATKTPFFAITHIAGQEDGNLDLIKHYQLGFVEENAKKAAKILKSIIDEPAVLAKFINPIDQMANYNQAAKQILLRIMANVKPD